MRCCCFEYNVTNPNFHFSINLVFIPSNAQNNITNPRKDAKEIPPNPNLRIVINRKWIKKSMAIIYSALMRGVK